MKRMLMLLVLSLVGFTTLFGCESAFDGIKGITCELQYVLCSDTNTDIVLCDSVKEKVEQYEKDSSEAKKQKKEISSQLKKVRNELKELDKWDDLNRYEFLLLERSRLESELNDASVTNVGITDKFLGDESLKLMMSEEFCSELLKVAETLNK